jgi:hypothetical protein
MNSPDRVSREKSCSHPREEEAWKNSEKSAIVAELKLAETLFLECCWHVQEEMRDCFCLPGLLQLHAGTEAGEDDQERGVLTLQHLQRKI